MRLRSQEVSRDFWRQNLEAKVTSQLKCGFTVVVVDQFAGFYVVWSVAFHFVFTVVALFVVLVVFKSWLCKLTMLPMMRLCKLMLVLLGTIIVDALSRLLSMSIALFLPAMLLSGRLVQILLRNCWPYLQQVAILTHCIGSFLISNLPLRLRRPAFPP